MFLNRDALASRSSTMHYSRAETVYADEVDPALNPAPEIIEKYGEFITPQPFVAEFENVHLLGPGGVGVTEAGDIILETAFAGRYDAADRNPEHVRIAQVAAGMPPVEVDLAVPMLGCWTSFYFHWLLEQLPKLEGIDLWMNKNGAAPVPRGKRRKELRWPTLIVQRNPPGFVTETLDMLGYNYIETSGHILAKQLLVPSHRRHQGRTAPGAVSWLRMNISKDKDDLLLDPKWVILDRHMAGERRLVNQHEVVEALEWPSFTAEKHTVATQADVWAGLSRIVAPHGGGLANMVFSNNLHVVEIFGEYVNPCFYLLAAACGHRYTPVRGTPAGQTGKDIYVDLETLKAVL